MENISMFDMMYPDYKINKPIRLIELFAGVGSQAMALRNIGADFEHYKISEWDVSATASYKAIHVENDNTDYSLEIEIAKLPKILFDYGISTDGKKPMTLKQIERKGEKWQRITYNNLRATNNLGNICNFKGEDLEIVDTDSFTYLLTYSFPCQDLSVAGKKKGMSKGDNTRSGLLWEVERLLNEVENLPQVLLMENVPQVIGKKNIEDFQLWQQFLEDKGYSNYTELLNAKNYGVAQNRERCFMVSLLGEWNYKFPKPIPLTKTMKDYLEDEVDEKYYIKSEKAQKLIQQLIDSGQLKNDTECVDGSVNDPKIKEISNCIKARYDAGISNFKSDGGMVVEVKVIGQMDNTIDHTFESANRVYSVDGLSPTLNTCGGGDRQPKMVIDDTQGFDGTRIYQDMCPTLRSQRSGLMTVEPALHKIGNIYDSKGQNGNIYSNTGISPAITSGTTENKNNGGIGSSNAPKVIVASRGRNPQNPSDRTPGNYVEQRLEPNSQGICNTLTSVQKDNLV
ncbi:MAG TPA: DNA (cytosine-5-)-methyltransferase, partial [Fervidobacterium nodosum]|nr:DNA (cytosine-5-)-methyltransferase [Fervidobacterium nodosum]